MGDHWTHDMEKDWDYWSDYSRISKWLDDEHRVDDCWFCKIVDMRIIINYMFKEQQE